MAASSTPLFAALPSDLKLNNRMQILEIFKTGGEYTANHIAGQIGISRQTVMKAIQFFIQKGLVVSTGKADSTNTGGKRPELFSLSARKYLLCVSLWPDMLHFTLLNFRFETADALHFRQPLPPTAAAAMQNIARVSAGLLREHSIAPELLCGVAVSTPGIVDYGTNVLKYNSLSPAWGRNIPVAKLLAPYFAPGTLILVENVAKVVGRSILHEKELQDKRVLTVFSSWGGVCASFIERGRILNGRDALIGEIGHMILAPDSPELCGCGCRGCFEQLVSNEQLRRCVRRAAAGHPDSPLSQTPLDTLTVGDVFRASAGGDAYAQELSAQLAHYFAVALHNISVAFDPELVVFHGEYAAAGRYFQERCLQELRAFQYYPNSGPFQLYMDRRPIQELDVRGAYTLLIDRLFSSASLYV